MIPLILTVLIAMGPVIPADKPQPTPMLIDGVEVLYMDDGEHTVIMDPLAMDESIYTREIDLGEEQASAEKIINKLHMGYTIVRMASPDPDSTCDDPADCGRSAKEACALFGKLVKKQEFDGVLKKCSWTCVGGGAGDSVCNDDDPGPGAPRPDTPIEAEN